MRAGLGICGLIALCISGFAQERTMFDVVSLKHVGDVQANMIQEGNSSHTDYRSFRYTPESVSAKEPLIQFLQEAFGLKDFQIQGPAWLTQEIYQLDARMTAGTSREVARQMLQSALADRLGLVVKREQKEYQVFALVKIPGSNKLQEIPTPEPPSFSYSARMDSIEATPGMPISALIFNLTRSAGRPVLDETGLKGFYKVSLHWSAEPIHPEPGQVIQVGVDPAMLSALPQIGLKVEPARRTLDSLVIEKVNKEPTEN
jgi:uncharacterized protein (TIGR03435 family)